MMLKNHIRVNACGFQIVFIITNFVSNILHQTLLPKADNVLKTKKVNQDPTLLGHHRTSHWFQQNLS